MDIKIEVPGVGSSTITGQLSDKYELTITKRYSQRVSGSAYMKVPGHLLSICEEYPHATKVVVDFRGSGLEWQKCNMLKRHIAQIQKLYSTIRLVVVGFD